MAVEPIAIIGMAGRFPRSDGLPEFWANLVAGRDCMTELDDEELLRYHERPDLIAHPGYVRRRPVIAESDMLDAELFGITPRDAEVRDPQYRLMLETVHAALEHAGYDPQRYPHQIGLFAAANVNRYRYDYIEQNPELVDAVGSVAVDFANNTDYLSTYVSYKLRLRGASATVLTACSSSLVALHMACTALRVGDCEMALAGGVDLEFPYHRGYVPVPGELRSPDGVVRAFSAGANGTNFGDGVGAVLLKPLSAALRDNDTVHAVVLGSAINNDGSRKVGYSAPSISGQAECIRQALANGGVRPADISLIEAHATGTPVGDPIELAGLLEAYRSASPDPLGTGFCAIGSVKSNIGHLGQAAGIAGLIKTVLALTHRQLPPTINVTTPNSAFDWAASPFFLNTSLRDWPAQPGRPRRAGVSSFGIGGTNAHAVIEEAPSRVEAPRRLRPVEVLTWSAASAAAESQLRERLAGHFQNLPEEEFADAAHTLRVGRTRQRVRAALVANGSADAGRRLGDAKQVRLGDDVAREIVFAFPGQGSQQPGMFRDLYEDEPLFRSGCDAAFEVLRPLLDRDLRAVWLSPGPDLSGTEVAQPLLYVLESTLAHCLMHWGVQPDVLIGHSLGEFVAGAVAGVFDFEDGLRAVAHRAMAIGRAPRGRMLAVGSSAETVQDEVTGRVVIAAVNSPREVVLSGPEDELREIAARLAARGLPGRELTTSHAFHSPAMATAAQEWEEVLRDLRLRAPGIPVVSAATGALLEPDEATSPRFWAGQVVQPVRFASAAEEIIERGPAHVLEVGPGRTLVTLLRSGRDGRAAGSRFLPTTGGKPGVALQTALAQLWVDGVPVSAWERDSERGYRRVVVPGYPYQRRRFWVDRANTPAPAPAAAQPPGTQPSAAPPAVAAAAVPGPSSAAPDIADTGRRWRLARTQWIRAGSAASGPSTAMSIGPALLLATSVDARIRSVQSALQRAGYRTRVLVDAAGPGADRGTAIDPTDADQWMAQLGHRAARPGGERVLLVHATLLEAPAHVCAADLDSQLAAGVTAVHGTLRAAAALRRRLRTPVRLTVLGRGLVDVSGGESVNPASAAVLGLLRSAELEVPGLRCHLVDVGDRPAESALVEALAGEDPLVAVRGATRWLPRLETVTPTASSTPTAASTPTALVSPVRERGTYLITGGLGGIGLVLARALAESGARPHLVLLGRTGVGSRSDGDEVSRQLAALEEAGASVLTFACDVGDAAALAAVVDDVEKRIGPVNGVVHSAGLAGGGLLDRRTPADLSTVLAPKAAGVLALDEVFADRAPLDFLLLCSSLAGATGMYGNADYAAANSFLDAYSVSRSSTGRRTVSVQWPGWTEVGMLARSPEGLALLNGSYHPPSGTADGPAAVADPDAALEQTVVPGDWQFSEHVFDGVAVMPGTGLLQLLVRGVLAQSATWPVALRDVIFTAPLVADGRRRVRVRVLPQEGGRRVILDSRAEAAEGAWIEHATATWVEAIPDSGTDVDLAGLRARMPRERPRQPASWMDFGPRWQVTTDVCGDDRETLARLVLPERFRPDLPDHPLHPAMVDIAAGLVVGGPDGTVQAPFHYHRVVAHAPISADVQVYARMHAQQRSGQQAVDFDVFDTGSGRLLLHVESYLTRTVAPGAFAAAASHGAPATTLPSPNGHGGGPGAHPSDPDPVRDPTLSPDEGAEIFLHLLQVATPPVVLVDLLGVSEPAAAGDAVPDTVPDAGPSAEVAARPPGRSGADAAVAARAADPTNGGRDIAGELHALWSSALGLTTIDPHADFFEIGGNSLAAVQLVNRISAHFGIELGAGSLFDQSTIDALAREIAKLLDAGV